MDYILAMLKMCINTISAAIFMPMQNIGFILFLLIAYNQYRKFAGFQEVVYGKPKFDLKNLFTTSILAGLVAGFAISLMITYAGVAMSSDMGLGYLIGISVILMLIEPRFICFSYSGGLLSLISLIFGIKSIDVTGILSLVAILHLLESVLIFVDGHRGAVPVFMERDDGTVVGGFSMQRFWPVPLALVLFAGYNVTSAGSIATPLWWPLIGPHLDPARIKYAMFELFPIAAMLGYSEFTSSKLPKEKTRDTSYKLAAFSLGLLVITYASSYIYILKFAAAIFAPAVHEYLIQRERKLEKKREPLYSPVERGIRILDTVPEGPGDKMKIQPGDIVMSINNKEVNSEEELAAFFKDYVSYIWIDVKDRNGETKTLEYRDYNKGIDGLDVIAVSPSKDGLIVVKERKGGIRSLFEKILKNK